MMLLHQDTLRAGATSTVGILLVGLIVVLLAVGCDGGGPTAPSGPQYPQVAGTYTGPLTFSSSLLSTELTGSMRMTVVQSGAQITVNGSVTFLGETEELPAFTGTINETGFVTVTGGGFSGTVSDPDCGTIATTSGTLTFSGRTARIHETATTDFCGNFTLSGTLTR